MIDFVVRAIIELSFFVTIFALKIVRMFILFQCINGYSFLIGVFDKETDAFKGQMEYPGNETIQSLSYLHKGALFSRTLMASDGTGKRMVATAFGLMDFYSISDDGDLSLLKSNHYHFPMFETGTNGPAVVFKKEDKAGITGMCTDKNYVYGLYLICHPMNFVDYQHLQ